MKATLVHNPTSGEGEISRDGLLRLLRKARIEPLYQSSDVGELTAILGEPTDIIIVAGGDGTVAKVLAQMPNRAVPVAILPLGTANNIAASFGIGGPLDALALGLRRAERRTLDIGIARGPWGRCHVVEGLGLGALVRTAQRLGDLDGSRAEKLKVARKAVRATLKKDEPDRTRIVVDGKPMPREHLMVEILNIAFAGPRLALAPKADMGDGLIDVVLLEPGQRKEMRRWLADERPDGPPPMLLRRGRKVRIEWDGTPLHIDDHIPPPEDGVVELELVGEPISILVPSVEGRPGVVR